MSNQGSGPLKAGNTCETLAPHRNDEMASAMLATAATNSDAPVADVAVFDTDYSGDAENTFDVSRAEFAELQEAFIRLSNRIANHNVGAPHKI